jgi:type VI protein secretion system component Hcp
MAKQAKKVAKLHKGKKLEEQKSLTTMVKHVDKASPALMLKCSL